jgi:cell wall assembly regulator SMI1
MSVVESWTAIKQLYLREKPEDVSLLRAGATADELGRLTSRFPLVSNELLELLGENNGVGSKSRHSTLGFNLLSIDNIVSSYDEWSQIANEMDNDENNEIDGNSFPDNAAKLEYFNRNYIPFADDYRGNSLVIDLAPEEKGVIGQVTCVGTEVKDRYVVSSSLGGFLNLLVSIHPNIDREMSEFPNGSTEFIWIDNGAPQIKHLFDLLPHLYEEGKLYKVES